MEIEKVIKELTLEDLRKTTWDYSQEVVIGLYEGKVITGFLFEVKEGGNIDPLTIQRCNVAEGWIEHYECKGDPIIMNNRIILPGTPELDEDGYSAKRVKLNCNVVIDVLDGQGNVIVSLS